MGGVSDVAVYDGSDPGKSRGRVTHARGSMGHLVKLASLLLKNTPNIPGQLRTVQIALDNAC